MNRWRMAGTALAASWHGDRTDTRQREARPGGRNTPRAERRPLAHARPRPTPDKTGMQATDPTRRHSRGHPPLYGPADSYRPQPTRLKRRLSPRDPSWSVLRTDAGSKGPIACSMTAAQTSRTLTGRPAALTRASTTAWTGTGFGLTTRLGMGSRRPSAATATRRRPAREPSSTARGLESAPFSSVTVTRGRAEGGASVELPRERSASSGLAASRLLSRRCRRGCLLPRESSLRLLGVRGRVPRLATGVASRESAAPDGGHSSRASHRSSEV